MSLSTCSITNQPLTHPVASRLTGHIYQKSTIQKHLQAFPYCPVTNKPMTLSDLIQIVPFSNLNTQTSAQKVNESVRVFMKKFEQQYDVLVLESHYLRQGIQQAREQLMHCAYQNQAAVRVIGRLLKEKAEIDDQIAKLKAQ